MKIFARILGVLIGLVLLSIAVSMMFYPTNDLQTLRTGLAPVADNMEVGQATLRGWIGGAFLTLVIMAFAGVIGQHAAPFRIIALFMFCSLMGRMVALGTVGSNPGSMRALIPEIVILLVALFVSARIGRVSNDENSLEVTWR